MIGASRSRRIAMALAGLYCLLAVRSSQAHEIASVELRIQEENAGQYSFGWVTRGIDAHALNDLAIAWPDHCEASGTRLRCATEGLQGRLRVDGIGASTAIVAVHLSTPAEERTYSLTASQPEARIESAGGLRQQDGEGGWRTARAYFLLGIEHILTGTDHLLFVLSLLMLVGFGAQLVSAVTAFTLAHSLSLAASTLGVLSVPPAPVEACIALSIALVCAEAITRRNTWTRQAPCMVAFCFGLLHGLGFAGALAEIGLSSRYLYTALAAFNLGVEAGQLTIIAVSWIAARLAMRQGWCRKARIWTLSAFGSTAAYWTIQRVLAIFA